MMADDVSVAHRFSTGDSSHRVRCVEARPVHWWKAEPATFMVAPIAAE
jgi:hypothetical protein